MIVYETLGQVEFLTLPPLRHHSVHGHSEPQVSYMDLLILDGFCHLSRALVGTTELTQWCSTWSLILQHGEAKGLRRERVETYLPRLGPGTPSLLSRSTRQKKSKVNANLSSRKRSSPHDEDSCKRHHQMHRCRWG